MKDWIKENGGPIVLTGIVLAVLAAFADWRIGVKIDDALSSQDIGTDAKIVDMDKNIASNKALSERNREEIDDNERRVEQAFEILMGN